MSFGLEFRKGCGLSDDIRDAGLITPDTVERYDDILYGEDPVSQSLDVYRPRDKKTQTLPVIVSVHGGGWVYGDKERYQFYCMSLAEQGFAVVNYTYHLAPEYKFPTSIQDANLVFAWVLAHATEYGFDTDRIYAVGDSAGAHQLGLYANIVTNPDYAKEFDFTVPKNLKLRAIALNCGAYDLEAKQEANPSNAELMTDFFPKRGTKEELQKASVLAHMTSAYPPTLYMTCTGDFLEGQAPLLEEALMKHRIPHEFHYFSDGEKDLGHVFHLNMKLPIAHACNAMECAYFRRV